MTVDIKTGPGLVAAIADQLNRTDLLPVIPTWVALAEAQIGRVLRTRDMVKRADATTADPYIVLPADFLEMKSVQMVSPIKRVLSLTSNDAMLELDSTPLINSQGWPYVDDSGPRSFTIIDGSIRIAPAPAAEVTLEIVYYAAIPALDCVTPGATNWLLSKAPDAYLYSALVFSAPYLGEDERIQMYSQMASGAVSGLNDQAVRGEHAGSRLTRKLRTF